MRQFSASRRQAASRNIRHKNTLASTVWLAYWDNYTEQGGRWRWVEERQYTWNHFKWRETRVVHCHCGQCVPIVHCSDDSRHCVHHCSTDCRMHAAPLCTTLQHQPVHHIIMSILMHQWNSWKTLYFSNSKLIKYIAPQILVEYFEKLIKTEQVWLNLRQKFRQ